VRVAPATPQIPVIKGIATYGNQALILRAWGQPEEAFGLLKKMEALCLELKGNRSGLAYCY
jgi:hypothetical protein